MQLIHFPRSLTGLARASLAFILLALALLGSARPAAAASISATPSGSGFQVSGLGSQILFYGLQQPYINSSGSLAWPSGADVKYVIGNGSSVTFVGGLRPNTTYYWAVPNNYGALGRTLQRRVDLNFTSIKITDDSDSVGKGELTFNFQVNSVRRKDFDFYRATGTNETFNPNRTAIVYNGGENLNSKIMVQDDDCEFSTCIIDPAMFNRGDNSDNEWTTASTSINFSDVQSNYSQKTLRLASFEWWIGMDASAVATIYYY
jgi:hypothetical protein